MYGTFILSRSACVWTLCGFEPQAFRLQPSKSKLRILHNFKVIRSERRSKFFGASLAGNRTRNTFLARGCKVCDSSPCCAKYLTSTTSLLFFKEHSDLTQIRTEIPNLGQYGSKCASLLNVYERFLGASAKSIRYSA